MRALETSSLGGGEWVRSVGEFGRELESLDDAFNEIEASRWYVVPAM